MSKVIFRRVDTTTLEQTGMNRNKPVETIKFQITNGGKTLTVTTTAQDNPGVDSVQVFDRQ